MKHSAYYGLHNKKLITNYIHSNALSRGYSLHTWEMNEIWTCIMNILIESFEEEIGPVFIENTLPAFCNENELSIFYGNYFHRIKDRIPNFEGDDSKKYFIVTDKLPFVAKFLKDSGSESILTNYTVVRPRTFALKSFLREEFVRYFQLLISSNLSKKEEYISKIERALSVFFKRINLHVILASRPSESYYQSKSCFYAIWPNNRLVSVLQCGLLKEEVVKSIYLSNDSFIIDIGGAQRLMASWLYANSDDYGIIYPPYFRNNDILFIIKKRTEVNAQIINLCKKYNMRVAIEDSLGKRKINQIRRQAYDESVLALVIQRYSSGSEFYDVFFRNGASIKIDSIGAVNDMLKLISNSINIEVLESQKQIINKYAKNGYLYPSLSKKPFSIIDVGLF